MLIRRRRASNRPTASATNNATAMATEIQITLDTRPSWHPAVLVSSTGRAYTAHQVLMRTFRRPREVALRAAPASVL